MVAPIKTSSSDGTVDISELSSWCDETELYLEELIVKCEQQIEIHKKAKVYFQSLKHGLAVPSIVLSIVMTVITDESPLYLKRIAFLLNSILNGLSLYFDAGSKMKLHCKSRDEYMKIVEEASQVVATPKDKRPPCRETINNFSKQFLTTSSNSP